MAYKLRKVVVETKVITLIQWFLNIRSEKLGHLKLYSRVKTEHVYVQHNDVLRRESSRMESLFLFLKILLRCSF